MKVTLADTSHHAVYLSDGSGSSGQRLAYILKRLLLSHSNSEGVTVQIAVVQSIVLLLKGPQSSSFAVTILKADTAGSLILFWWYLYPTHVCFYAFTTQKCLQSHYVFRLSCCLICSSIRSSVRYCYHDISWTAWTILMKLIENIHWPLQVA